MVSTKKDWKQHSRVDTSQATIAFALALVSWVPLFNLFLCPLSLVFSIMSLNSQRKQPKLYGGHKRAIAALVICCIWILLFIYSLIFIGPQIMFTR